MGLSIVFSLGIAKGPKKASTAGENNNKSAPEQYNFREKVRQNSTEIFH
jgi:hypothetical protein